MNGERAELLSMLFGYFPPQALHVATRVGLADQLAEGPRPPRNSPWPPAASPRRWGACCARWSSSACWSSPMPR